MKCEVCRVPLQENQVSNFQGKVLCEDCCFDLMNPPKVCDPLAVSSTLSVRKQLGQTGTDGLTDLQKQIYSIVIELGTISREELTNQLKMTPQEMERQFATLRHCELLRAFKEGDIIYLTKY